MIKLFPHQLDFLVFSQQRVWTIYNNEYQSISSGQWLWILKWLHTIKDISLCNLWKVKQAAPDETFQTNVTFSLQVDAIANQRSSI